jgi:hypothetical protein
MSANLTCALCNANNYKELGYLANVSVVSYNLEEDSVTQRVDLVCGHFFCGKCMEAPHTTCPIEPNERFSRYAKLTENFSPGLMKVRLSPDNVEQIFKELLSTNLRIAKLVLNRHFSDNSLHQIIAEKYSELLKSRKFKEAREMVTQLGIESKVLESPIFQDEFLSMESLKDYSYEPLLTKLTGAGLWAKYLVKGFLESGQVDDALELVSYLKPIDVYQKMKLQSAIANHYRKNNDFDKCQKMLGLLEREIINLNESKKNLNEKSDPYLSSIVYLSIAESYLKIDKIDEAKQYLRVVEDLCNEINREKKSRILFGLAILYKMIDSKKSWSISCKNSPEILKASWAAQEALRIHQSNSSSSTDKRYFKREDTLLTFSKSLNRRISCNEGLSFAGRWLLRITCVATVVFGAYFARRLPLTSIPIVF